MRTKIKKGLLITSLIIIFIAVGIYSIYLSNGKLLKTSDLISIIILPTILTLFIMLIQFISSYESTNFLRLIKKKKNITFVVSDIGGCIVPKTREGFDSRKLYKLKQIVNKKKTPQLIIMTGRGQGYVELLGQMLGLTSNEKLKDIPIIIENGSAYYYPYNKETIPRINLEDLKRLRNLESQIRDKFGNNIIFESKSYMITINPNFKDDLGEVDTSQLKEKIINFISQEYDSDYKAFEVVNTSTAVDITILGYNKESALEEIIEKQNVGYNNIAYCINDSPDIKLINTIKNKDKTILDRTFASLNEINSQSFLIKEIHEDNKFTSSPPIFLHDVLKKCKV